MMHSGCKKLLLLLFLFIAIFIGNSDGDTQEEISHKARASPDGNVRRNVIDGSGVEKTLHDIGMGDQKRGSSHSKVSVSTVVLFTLAMAAATGLGAVPFFFVELDPQWAGICNGMAAGVMLAASFDLVKEGQEHGSGNWVVTGILAGGLFIWLCKQAAGSVSLVSSEFGFGSFFFLLSNVFSIIPLTTSPNPSSLAVLIPNESNILRASISSCAGKLHDLVSVLSLIWETVTSSCCSFDSTTPLEFFRFHLNFEKLASNQMMHPRCKKLLLLLFLFIAIFIGNTDGDPQEEIEISHKARASPDGNTGRNVIDGSGVEKTLHDIGMGDQKRGSSHSKVSVSTVVLFTLAMAAATGLGAVPFFFVELDPQWAGICNGMAAGVMLAASFDLVKEGQEHGSGNWVVTGILAGGLFIWLCKQDRSILAGIDYSGLDHVMMVACGGLLPSFWQVINRAVKLERKKGSVGMVLGVACAVVCLTFTRLVCLHTTCCNSAAEAVR
ncbi:hypothetical protein F2Q70_00037602 [Brassica cretica]|uniref:Zinc transporter n=1 Tax=Brassica cretica TaxID=69181 RepID=A0A8S9JZY0_BRACR|nr:hypothetical protein F2Q70_00037602 [Brassica cretica]